jgi:hypothetical protein
LFLAFVKVREVYSCGSVVSVVSTVIDTASSVRLVVVALLSAVKVVVPLLVLWWADGTDYYLCAVILS